ncbi:MULTISPECIES: transposase [Streptomycetaceae]|uniref:transposase n=1 Tax=Streptomycetaceae TaxID=2062 RepID=UPI001E5DFA9E|nr:MULTISPECIES: transposase [Streptomycetaceae]
MITLDGKGAKAGWPPVWPRRRLIDGIRFRVRTGVPWRDVPIEWGPWGRVYDLFRRWPGDAPYAGGGPCRDGWAGVTTYITGTHLHGPAAVRLPHAAAGFDHCTTTDGWCGRARQAAALSPRRPACLERDPQVSRDGRAARWTEFESTFHFLIRRGPLDTLHRYGV